MRLLHAFLTLILRSAPANTAEITKVYTAAAACWLPAYRSTHAHTHTQAYTDTHKSLAAKK